MCDRKCFKVATFQHSGDSCPPKTHTIGIYVTHLRHWSTYARKTSSRVLAPSLSSRVNHHESVGRRGRGPDRRRGARDRGVAGRGARVHARARRRPADADAAAGQVVLAARESATKP